MDSVTSDIVWHTLLVIVYVSMGAIVVVAAFASVRDTRRRLRYAERRAREEQLREANEQIREATNAVRVIQARQQAEQQFRQEVGRILAPPATATTGRSPVANQLNPALREATLTAITKCAKEWVSTRELADALGLTPQAAYGRADRLRQAGWLRARQRWVVERRSRRGYNSLTNDRAYVMEWALSQKARNRAVTPVAIAAAAPKPASEVEIDEVFHRQRRSLGQNPK